MSLAVPYLGSSPLTVAACVLWGDTAAHLEQVGAPDSAQLAARAEPVVFWAWSSFPGPGGVLMFLLKLLYSHVLLL